MFHRAKTACTVRANAIRMFLNGNGSIELESEKNTFIMKGGPARSQKQRKNRKAVMSNRPGAGESEAMKKFLRSSRVFRLLAEPSPLLQNLFFYEKRTISIDNTFCICYT